MQNTINEKNESITFRKDEIKKMYLEIEYILISLHRMGSYYVDNGTLEDYYRETTMFIDNSEVCDRFAKIRALLDEHLDPCCSEKEIEQFEDSCENLPKWRKPGDFTREKWLQRTIR